MTDDYKEKVLSYLTGNLDKELTNNTPYYTDTTTEQLSSSNYGGTGKIKCTDSNGNYNGKIIFYGHDGYGENYIDLYDENGILLKHITKFSSGTDLWPIITLNVDEVGNIYGVFADVLGGGIVNARFILMNNISEKTLSGDYEAILRASYFIQTSISYENMNYTDCVGLVKSKQSSSYFMLWYYTGNSTVGQEKIFGIRFNINVGATNDWVDYTPIVVGYSDFKFIDYTMFNESDNLQVLTYLTRYNNGNLDIYKLINSDTSLSYSSYLTILNASQSAVLKLATNEFYILSHLETYLNNTLTTYIKLYLVKDANYRLIFENNSTVTGNYIISLNQDFLDIVNNVPFYCYYIPYNTTDNYKLYYGIIPGNSDVPIQFEIENVDATENFFVNNIFNIYNLIVIYYKNGYYKEITKIIFNTQNYNGTEYENTNSLLPKQGVLYDENNNLLFARNLYNYKVYNNRSMSVLNVPNTFLNNIDITNQQLLSSTNCTLVSSMETINKNIYEDLYINFNNQITMQNQNEDNYVDNLEGAIRLNQSSSSDLDYDNAKANKIRVNYDDNTNYVTTAPNSITDNVCTYTIGVHVPSNKNVQSIEIISNDENTTYQTITNLNLENNKYYVITQDVHVA